MADRNARGTATALVTGASRGIGLAIARGLAARGFRVVLTARGTDELERARLSIGPTAASVAADLCDPAAPARLLAAVRERFGAPDVIVNNAGIAPSERFERTDDATLDLALDLHVRAPFRLLRLALPDLRESPRGCAVQVASTAGLVGFPFTAAYCAAKHAMVGLTRALHAEFARGPRVYAVCPGFVDTAITRAAARAIAARGRQTEDEAFAALAAMNRIGRMHTPQEVADAVLWLVTEQPDGCVFDLDREKPCFV